MKTYTLNTGKAVPAIGFGTWQIRQNADAKAAVSHALKVGYRLIDTAKIYGNEKGVGEAIRESGIPRGEIFLTTKLWNGDQGYESALQAIDESLDKLGTDYVDLYLIHWPASGKRHDSYRAMEEIAKSGRAKAIGVSNYTIRHLKEVLDSFETVPAVNQVEFHPFLYAEQQELLEFCRQQGILLEAYSPLAQGEKLDDSTLQRLADKYQKSTAQIMLRWAIEHDTLPIPRSTNPERIAQNFEVFDFDISPADMQVIDSLSNSTRLAWDPTTME